MIVKILQPSTTFKGVRYNTTKIINDMGELMKVANFGALQALQNLRPEDYVNYLEAQSSASKRTKYPQLHAVISCKGRSHSKEELAAIAENWLEGMGYGNQPYLLVFHKDTKNNHLHMVTTRVGKDGKKINDSYEKLRAYEVLNRIIGLDEKQQAIADIEKALSYGFSTRAQFMMVLEAQGYALKLSDGKYQVSRYGKQQGTVPLEKVDAQIALFKKDIDRLAQLRAVFAKYRDGHDPTVIHVSTPQPGGKSSSLSGYTSYMAEMLFAKFGVQVMFHGKEDKPPYGYTLIDHSRKMVYKGKDLMPLAEFIKPSEDGPRIFPKTDKTDHTVRERKSPIQDSPEIATKTDRKDQANKEQTYPFEDSPEIATKTDRKDYTVREQTSSSKEITPDADYVQGTAQPWMPGIQIDISDDIDDEAIHGRNRRRKRKARTNTR